MSLPILRLFDGFDHTSPQLRDAVKMLQRALQREKIPLRLDGKFGHDTEDAVKTFQRARGLDDDGIVGPLTWKALFPDRPLPTSPVGEPATGPTVVVYAPDDRGLLRELKEAAQYREIVAQAAATYDLEVAVIGGVGSRESRWGLALKCSPGNPVRAAGTGDPKQRKRTTEFRSGPLPPNGGGFGRGLMQIDYDSHEFARTGNWTDPQANIRYGCSVLADARTVLLQSPGLSDYGLLRAMLASYNAGTARVLRGLANGHDVDFFTTGRNYSLDVLARADFFREHGWF